MLNSLNLFVIILILRINKKLYKEKVMGGIVYTIGDSKLFENGFQTNEMKKYRAYTDIKEVQINGQNLKITYINHKGKLKDTKIEIGRGMDQVREFLMTKCRTVDSRKRTFTESFKVFSYPITALFWMTLVAGLVCSELPNSGSVSVPVICIPAIKVVQSIGIRNVIYIDVAILILTILGTIASFKKEHQVETLSNFW